ncbi:MAG TPA: winged helix-turn-helix domain-containing protein [Rudaea sp.]|nr:winged helix-turn-helix domain-containing protein [Rudaea sp.]
MTEQVLDSDLHLNYAADLPGSAETPVRGWRAGDLIVDLELRRLYRDGRRVTLQETPLRLLCLLLERGGRPLARRELHEALWPRYEWDSFERNVNTAVRKLRQAIGDDAREPRLIETLRASGYRWIGQAPGALSTVPIFEADANTAMAGHATPAIAIASRPVWRRALVPGAIAAGLICLLVFVAAYSPPQPRPLLVVDVDNPAGFAPPDTAKVRVLREMLAGALATNAAASEAGAPVRVALTLRNDQPVNAEVSGRGGKERIALGDTAFGRERLLVEVASRMPAAAVSRADTTLPAPAQRAFAEAGTLIPGVTDTASVERVLGLLESVLSAVPNHAGALRMYARAQRLHAVFGRNAADARERRLLARDALRRAVRADPRSAGIAADVAGQLFWGEWNSKEAADWFALARRAAPQDAEVLRSYAWFALADDRIDAALEAMNAALAVAPLSVDLHSDLGWFYFRTGRYDDALRQCRVALQMSARDESAQTCEERALSELGHPEQAWEALQRHAPQWLDARSMQEFSKAGADRAYRMAMHLAAARTRERFGAGFESASLEAIAGDRSAVDSDLAAAVALGDPGLHMARVTPELARMLGAPAVRHLADSGAAPLLAGDSG